MTDTQGSSQEGKIKEARSRRLLIPLLLTAVIAALAGGAGVWLIMHYPDRLLSSEQTGRPKTIYQCPMHPTITSDHPGDCPICGMKLVPVTQPAPEKNAAPPAGERKISFYRSPMNPQQTSPVPDKDEMGMDYLPVYEDELNGEQARPVPGMAEVSIDPARQQLIGLRTEPVTRGPVGGSWRTVGTIEVDPTRVRKTNVKIEGYVERIFVDFVGQPVQKGQALFSVYSPSLLATQNEYILAVKTREALSKGRTLTGDGETLVAAAKRKLELWDVPAGEIKRLERTGQPSKTITFYSPISGVVTAKNVVQGSSLNPGDTPYEITDLGEVWLMADAYESDLDKVQVGMTATLTLQAYPNRAFQGRVEFIDPVLNPQTRTAKVRVTFPNPDGELKPGLYGEVRLEGKTHEGLLVPADAVIRSGTMNVVFVALEQGKFQPREIKLGEKNGDMVEVLSGLKEGQKVVKSANFLIDSESRLRASLSALEGK